MRRLIPGIVRSSSAKRIGPLLAAAMIAIPHLLPIRSRASRNAAHAPGSTSSGSRESAGISLLPYRKTSLPPTATSVTDKPL
ncbi:hypothetical protein D3C83_155700 [compost metagenome]